MKFEDRIGLVQWFHIGEHALVEQTLANMKKLGVRHLRTGLSWADFHRPEGEQWYSWLLPRLARQVEVLPCICYTPATLALEPRTSSPPRDPDDFAGFVDWVMLRFGDSFEWVELWNEPNNLSEYDWTLDPDWTTFCTMIRKAAIYAHQRGKKTLLAATSPTDPPLLDHLFTEGVGQHFDALGVHGFPGTWETNWKSWEHTFQQVQQVLDKHQWHAPIWITETGYSLWNHTIQQQLQTFLEAVDAPTERVYWYSLYDLHPDRVALDGFHQDEREYHFGIRQHNDQPKTLFSLWSSGGIDLIRDVARSAITIENQPSQVLVTGGAGFVGTNLVSRLLEDGHRVTLYDNVSRANVERNLHWLQEHYRDQLRVTLADVRNPYQLKDAVTGVDTVYHFAAQVAVTTSLDDPQNDFGINAQGTLHLLEAIRAQQTPPALIFTSTNKVYGHLDDVDIIEMNRRYEPVNSQVRRFGISEAQPLSFYSPYACSKGAADQYILDYGRIYGLRTLVFRMSCIYGPHQYGNEDQGWVAHFVIRTLNNEPIMIFGNGKQVRDVLYVEDLVDAFLRATDQIDTIFGQAFNIGGGVSNSVSLLEVLDLIRRIHGRAPRVQFADWRPGDQCYYVSDTRKFQQATGWQPRVQVEDGLQRLYRWLAAHVCEGEIQLLQEQAGD